MANKKIEILKNLFYEGKYAFLRNDKKTLKIFKINWFKRLRENINIFTKKDLEKIFNKFAKRLREKIIY